MNRREMIAGLAGAAAWSLPARAQAPLPVIGYLSQGWPDGGAALVAAAFTGKHTPCHRSCTTLPS